MDATGLSILLKELQTDCGVAGDAAHKAAMRLDEKSSGHLEACAYDLTLRADRLTELAGIAGQLARDLPAWCDDFGAQVRTQQGWK